MLYTMFQILVDFVELEQPFNEFSCRYDNIRHTNRLEMHEYIERWYNSPEGLKSNYYDGISDAGRIEMDAITRRQYADKSEILYLYEWYKDKKYDLDLMKLYQKTGTDFVLKSGRIEYVSNGREALITNNEVADISEDHDAVCNNMLYRILAVRQHLWT